MTHIKFKSSPANPGPVTIDDGKHKPMALRRSTDGQLLRGGDLVAGRVYEVYIETGTVRWPPKNRKERRRRDDI
jgi:hypothetical protein